MSTISVAWMALLQKSDPISQLLKGAVPLQSSCEAGPNHRSSRSAAATPLSCPRRASPRLGSSCGPYARRRLCPSRGRRPHVESTCRAAVSAVRPDWLRYYPTRIRAGSGYFLLECPQKRTEPAGENSVFRSQVAGQQWVPRIAHTRSSVIAPPQHPFPLATPHRAPNGVPCWAPPAKKATKNPCVPRSRRWLAP